MYLSTIDFHVNFTMSQLGLYLEKDRHVALTLERSPPLDEEPLMGDEELMSYKRPRSPTSSIWAPRAPRVIVVFSCILCFALGLVIRPRADGLPDGLALFSDSYYNLNGDSNDHNNNSLACMPCLDGDPICDKWGRSAIARSRAYEGSGSQLQRILSKLQGGEEVRVGIVGGSISACAEVKRHECYPSRLGDELTRIFKPYGTRFKVFNGAIFGTASAFFSTCWQVSLPANLDLLIAEFSVNDDKSILIDKDMDALIRSVAGMEDGPSIMLLDLYSPQNLWYDASQGINTLGQYHDVPVISVRNVLYHIRHPTTSKWPDFWSTGRGTWPAGHHLTALGHAYAGGMLASFLQEQACRLSDPSFTTPRLGSIFDELPRVPAAKAWVAEDEREESPTSVGLCLSATPGSDLQMDLSPASQGFSFGSWKTKTFLVGKNAGDVAVIDLHHAHTGPHHVFHVYYWRSHTIGFGQVSCYLNGNENLTTGALDGYWIEASNIPVKGELIHKEDYLDNLTCTILPTTNDPEGRHEFRITSIVASNF